MKRIEHLSFIAHDMGLVFKLLGIASLLPFIVIVIFREWAMLRPMASAPVAFFVVGYLLTKAAPKTDFTPPVSVTLVAVAISWFAIALLGALPCVFGIGISYTNVVFEAMSG